MNNALDRGLSLLEQLAGHPEGLSLTALAEAIEVSKGACHRVLADLNARGYVRQIRAQGDYVMTTKVAALGLGFLSVSGIVDIAAPVIERLAQKSGELVRLSLVDDGRLTWVAKADGGRQGFRYDPDMGMDARLSCTASGHAWLMTLSDEEALALVSKQGFGPKREYGPNAPTTVKALQGFLHAARVRGYAMIDEVFAPGMSAVAVPVHRRGRAATGVISIAGPRSRLTTAHMQQLGQQMIDAASDLAATTNASGLFARTPLGKA